MGRGHLSLGTLILTVEPGRGGEGSFVPGTMILTIEPGRGHLWNNDYRIAGNFSEIETFTIFASRHENAKV